MPETIHGTFWVDNNNQRLTGVLTCGHGIQNTLEINGHLIDDFNFSKTPEPVNITGIVDSGFQHVALRHCFAINSSGFPGYPGSTQKILCNQVLKGQLTFENDNEITAKSLTVSMWPLHEWVNPQLLKSNWLSLGDDPIAIETLPNSTITIANCKSGTLTFDLEVQSYKAFSQSQQRLLIQAKTSVSINPHQEATPIADLLSVAHKLQEFFTLLAGKAATINLATFKAPDPDLQHPKYNTAIFAEWFGGPPNEEASKSGWSQIPFREVRLPFINPDALRKWFNLCDEYDPAIPWLTSRHFHPQSLSDIQFNATFTALERLISQHLGPKRPGRSRGYGLGESRASAESLVEFINKTAIANTEHFSKKTPEELLDWAKYILTVRDKFTVHLDWNHKEDPPDDFYEQEHILASIATGFLMEQMDFPQKATIGFLNQTLARV